MGESSLFDKLFNVNVVICILIHYLNITLVVFVEALRYLGTLLALGTMVDPCWFKHRIGI